MTDSAQPTTLDINDIFRILPHRYPFLLIDRVVEIARKQRIVAIKNVTINEPFFTGHFPNMTLSSTSGDVSLDRAAWGGITGSSPFPPLPTEFRGDYLALRFHFYYNPDSNEMQ